MVRLVTVGVAAAVPAIRAVRWLPPVGGLLVGYAMVGLPAAVSGPSSPELLVILLRLAAVCAGLAVGFLLDDPSRPTTLTSPTPAWLPLAARLGAGAVVLAAWWWATLATALAAAGPASVVLPRGDLTLETAAVVAVAVAAGTLVWRRSARGSVGLVAAPVFLAAVVVAALLPDRVALLAAPGAPTWDAAHDRWMVVLIGAGTGALLAATWSPVSPRRTTAAASG
ncbi:hypothetical protein [Asanoa siamensis]|uniref:ABC-2 type transport system permease protein n=1 Tax=Asanoa siamensis TaxID=926357 RepID=A0ABQ4CXX9_9ACTN|nr:hypothetical protein [Asanoa siamensis]GIF76135.1 hypothetical protein Asi02nite_56530 [Asanoa siamensis]